MISAIAFGGKTGTRRDEGGWPSRPFDFRIQKRLLES